jgi:hypothetical protein
VADFNFDDSSTWNPPGGCTIKINLPSSIDVMIYKSTQHRGWNTHATLEANDVITGESQSFGSVNKYPKKPTREEIVDHVMSQIRHEVEEQMGMRPHDE